MSAQKSREPRVPVRLSVRVRTDFGWGDAQVQNVSSRGMMATCTTPPPRGSYVEVRCGSYAVVGRVVWSSRNRFGLFTQDYIVIEDLTGSVAGPASGERRRQPRHPEQGHARRASPADIAAASRRFSRLFDAVVMIGAIGAGALLLAQLVSEAIDTPLEQARIAMGSAEPSSKRD